MLRLVSSANHPHIANLIDDSESAVGVHAYLHYCGKGSLMAHIARLRKKQMGMPEPDAAIVTAQMAAALEHLHGLGVAHRDLKPANILHDGQNWRLCDFGFSVAAGPEGKQRLKSKVSTQGLIPCTSHRRSTPRSYI